jgi:large conductance mechanosensitive channel
MTRQEKKILREEVKAAKKEFKKRMKAERVSFWADFKKFITRGNVIDLAVGVVVGSAFSAITNGLVKFIINPVISLLTGGVSLENWKTVLVPAVEADAEAGIEAVAEVAILWGQWVQTIIQFFIIALSIFTAVRIIKGINDKLRFRELEAARKAAEEKKAADKLAADKAAAAAAEKEAQLQAFYANVARQTELLEKLAEK